MMSKRDETCNEMVGKTKLTGDFARNIIKRLKPQTVIHIVDFPFTDTQIFFGDGRWTMTEKLHQKDNFMPENEIKVTDVVKRNTISPFV